jgi:uncharacterized protein
MQTELYKRANMTVNILTGRIPRLRQSRQYIQLQCQYCYRDRPMITLDQIQAFSQQIVEKFQPERIILFGSYAYGQPTEDSDVDLLVILPFEDFPIYKAIEIRRQVRPPFPLDLMARTAEQIQQRLDMGDFFIRDIIQKGRILYETNHSRVGR